jgi:DNA polymerase-3 subunit gamma/tau
MQFGMADLTHAAEVVSETLNGMSGATSPKLQLELMCAKVLVPAADQSEVGSLARIERLERRIGMAGSTETSVVNASPISKAAPEVAPSSTPIAAPVAALSTAAFKDAWKEILDVVNKANKAAWMLAFGLQVVDFEPGDSVLTLQFTSARDLESFKSSSNAPDILRKSIDQVLGITVKFKPLIAGAVAAKTEALPVVTVETPAEVSAELEPIEDQVADEKIVEEVAPVAEKKSPAKSRNSKLVKEEERYGDSLLREMLGAEPVDEKKTR